MKCDLIISAIGCIDGSLIDEAENYRPKRGKKAWLWAAASVACLCVVVFIASRFSPVVNCNAELIGVVGAEAQSGFLDYRERAETGKVLITDELAGLMDEHRDTRCRKYEFSVRITDANGAGRDDISYSCLLPLGINGNERGEFISSGVISLSRKEILTIKATPQMALIVYPSRVGIGEEFLDTVERGSLDVWVELEFDNELLNESEYISEYAEDNGVDLNDIKEYGASGTFSARLDTELIKKLLQDERTRAVYFEDV